MSEPPASTLPRSFARFLLRAGRVLLLALLGAIALLFFSQHAMIYHPHPYGANYRRLLPPGALELGSNTAAGRQTAFYLPNRPDSSLPRRIWVAFCGNGSLALDWTPLAARDRNASDAFLLIDYPGYGKSEGRASVATTRAAADGAVTALAARLGASAAQLEPRLDVIGHSLGAAAALDFATHHPVQWVVLLSPFTTLREEAATVTGDLLSYLLRDNYDNRAALRVLARRHPPPRVAIFHGLDDRLIPVRMSRELAVEFPAIISFHPVPDADHDNIVPAAEDAILAWVNQD